MSEHQPEQPQRLLDGIDGPEDLHALSDEQLSGLAQEVREHIIETVGEIGGHFGANLGTCELAVALHSLLDSPRDKILWDVGHQAYPHKILTGRRDRLSTIRQYGGLAPFCSREESPHDIMGAGHASTSIGYAVGIKEGMRHAGRYEGGAAGQGPASRAPRPPQSGEGKVVAVIGDGAMTGGVAFEAIGQAGGLGTPIVVVLNDNGMSIAPNVGALSKYFNRVRLNPKLWHAREGVEGGLTRLPGGIGAALERIGPQLKESIKAFWAPGLWWEELDWAYMGVVDGHDVRALREALREALAAERPVVCAACGHTRLKVLRVGVARVREELAALLGVEVAEVSGPDDAPVPDTQVLVGTEAVLHRVRRAEVVAFLDFDMHLLAPRLSAGEEALALLARAGRLVP